jgi:Uma2 family endonuclease
MSSPTVTPAIPPLKDGDRLTREEFERRYDAMPEVKKAELIYGVVHMPSPVNWGRHSSPHGYILAWLGVYSAATPGTDFGDNGSIRLGDDSMPQPDAALIVLPSHGGRVTISDDDYLEDGPELVVEVSGSSVPVDRGPKFRLYQEHGVQEYLIWMVDRGQLEWHVLRDGQYQLLAAHPDGTLRSEVFPGLWLDAAALVNRDIARVLTVLQQGIATPEHAAFVQRLAAAATP